MINFKRILLLLTFFVLSACTTGLSNSQIKQVLNNEKAIVFYSARIIRAKGSYRPAFIILEKDETNEMVLNSEISTDPSKYLFSGFAWADYSVYSTETKIAYLDNPFELDIKGGEVLYLGDIKLYLDSSGGTRVMLEDNFNKTYEEVSKKYPQLLERLERKIILKPISTQKSVLIR